MCYCFIPICGRNDGLLGRGEEWNLSSNNGADNREEREKIHDCDGGWIEIPQERSYL